MLALFIAWIPMLFISYTWGDALTVSFNNLSKRKENYNLFETVSLGLFSLGLVLLLWAFVFPSNHVFLFIALGVSVVYSIWQKKRIGKVVSDLQMKLGQLNRSQLVFLFIMFVTILASSMWMQGNWDPVTYHYHNINWNENFAVVPGLGNLEDRLGFDSIYMLVSAIFTFSFVWGEAIYPLQSLVFFLFTAWVLFELFSSKYEIKRVVLFLAYVIFSLLNVKDMPDTSTDILPNILVFYIIAKVTLYPSFIRNNLLFTITIPTFAILCKLSMAPFVIIVIYAICLAWKERKKMTAFFPLILISICGVAWLARNVIQTGYLIYPFYQLDLFNFDWKVPIEIAKSQSDTVKSVGKRYFYYTIQNPLMNGRDPVWISLLTVINYAVCLVSIIISAVVLFINKKEKEYQDILIVFIASVGCLVLWFTNGPDARFVLGVILGLIFLAASLVLKKDTYIPRKYATLIIAISILPFLVASLWRVADRHKLVVQRSLDWKRPAWDSFIKPYPHQIYLDAINNLDMMTYYVSFELENGEKVYIARALFEFNKLPTTTDIKISNKRSDYRYLDSRGPSLQEGFRTSKVMLREVDLDNNPTIAN